MARDRSGPLHEQKATPSRRNAAGRAVLGLSLFFLANLTIGIYYWLPARAPALGLVPVPEAAGLAALVAAAALVRGRSSWGVSILAGLLAAVVFAFAVGEAFFQAVYREQFFMWRNIRFLPDFLRMVSGVEALARPGLVVAVVALLLGTLSGAYALLFGALGRVIAGTWRPAGVMITGVLLLFGAVTAVTILPGRPAGLSLAEQLVRGPGITRAGAEAETEDEAAAAGGSDAGESAAAVDGGEGSGDNAAAGADSPTAAAAPGPEYAFANLRDADVRIFIIESYGHTLFTREDHYELIAPVYDRLGSQLEDAGFTTYSHFMKSPAFGGRSWLADATILAGRWIGDQETYDAMWDTDTETLVRIMDDAGYHTVLAAPGMTFLEEGFPDFFPYDRVYLQGDFGYQGKRYSFGGGITDQFLLNQVRLRRSAGDTETTSAAVAMEGEPFFGVYVMVSSHVPFNVLPPFIEDWSTIGDGSIYNDLPRRIFDNDWLRGGEYPEGYTASIEYSLRTVVDFLTTFVADDALAVIIGDHQPRIPIAERSSTFSVPVHVVSRNTELLRRFSAFGFERGLEPSQPTPHPGMDEFQAMFLEAAGGDDAVADGR